MPGYALFRKDRNKFGGGIIIYVKEYLTSCFYDSSDLKFCESLFLSIQIENTEEIIVGEIYKPPSQNTGNFLDSFSSFLETVPSSKHTVICGDFNLDFLSSSHNCHVYKDILLSNNMRQIIDKPTRESLFSSSLIDHIIIGHHTTNASSQVHNFSNSDHHLLTMSYKVTRHKIRKSENSKVEFRSFKHFNINSFISTLY